jgi:choline dehydrogenase-like flavoprotein
MFIDARTIAKGTTIDADVCIIGAGAAGITLAREFKGQPFKVCLLESGGLEYEVDTQALYRGKNIGLPYYPLDVARLRYFGGTTNHWGGACRPLDEIDFEARDWVPHSGWPFGRAHLVSYYERAGSVLQIGPFAYEAKDWETDERQPAKFNDGALTSSVLQQSPPTRFGQVYRDELRQAGNIDTYLHANVLEIETNASGKSATRLRASSLERNEFHVTAKLIVVATGAIENARLLLLSNRFDSRGLGNGHGLVGRFFMDHPIAGWGQVGIVAPSGFPLEFYKERNEGTIVENGVDRHGVTWGFIRPSEQTVRRLKLLGCGIGIRATPLKTHSKGIESARRLKKAIGSGKWPDNFWEQVGNVVSDLDDVTFLGAQKLTGKKPATMVEILYWGEPAPDPDSRVSLSNDHDVLGQRKVSLDWELSPLVSKTMRQVLEKFAIELGRSSLGRLGVNPVIWDDKWTSLFSGSYHHMGTTRMHKDPRKGVVDADCRMHGVSNVYVAGSSVFPNAGYANPTMTIVALALRLADHLKTRLRGM